MNPSSTLSSQHLLDSLTEVLQHGVRLLESLDDSTFTRKLPVAFNSSIGSHYRHCLDHFSSLMNARNAAELNYDHRNRDLRLETERGFALSSTHDLIATAATFSIQEMDHPLLVRSKVSYQAKDSPLVPSTLGREIMYVVTHAVHHYALISFICQSFGHAMPEGFGVAPSTLQHQKKLETKEPVLLT